MAALFGHGNPLATPVGQMIERATDGSQSSENWALFLEICDRITETEEGPKDAIRAFRKRLNQNMGKNHTAILYTLTSLETAVKNCGRRFHTQVAHKDFLNDMVKVIGPKYDPPQAVQEKVLSLIQTWADAFRGVPDLKDVEKVYQDLKSKGIEFPMTDLDSLAPIHTPARTHGSDPPEPIRAQRGGTTNRSSAYVIEDEEDASHVAMTRSPGQVIQTAQGYPPPQPVIPPASTTPGLPSQEQLTKLKSELDVVQGNVRVMSEMLTELTPSTVDSSDLELLQELNRTNRQMQQRLVELLDSVPNEEVTNELLRVNDDLNNVFLRYERFERYRTGQTGQGSESEGTTEPVAEPPQSASFAPPSYESVQQANPAVANLIDFGDESSSNGAVTNQMAQMNVNEVQPPGRPDDDFDMFAHSRQSFDQNKDSKTTYVNDDQYGQGLGQAVNAKLQPEQRTPEEILKLQDKETDYDEMEKWLEQHEQEAAQGEEPVSSTDFDKFLTERASAASTLPTISAQTGPQSRKNARSRQLQKDDDDNPMFAL